MNETVNVVKKDVVIQPFQIKTRLRRSPMQLAGVCDAIKKIIQIYARKNGRGRNGSAPGLGIVETRHGTSLQGSVHIYQCLRPGCMA